MNAVHAPTNFWYEDRTPAPLTSQLCPSLIVVKNKTGRTEGLSNVKVLPAYLGTGALRDCNAYAEVNV